MQKCLGLQKGLEERIPPMLNYWPASALALPSLAISSSFFRLVCAPVKKMTRQAVAAMKAALKMRALCMCNGGSAVAGARSASITSWEEVSMKA